MKRLLIALGLLAVLALPATASAQGTWTSNRFYAPSGWIECRLVGNHGLPYIACMSLYSGHVAVVYQHGPAVNVVDDLPQARNLFDWAKHPTLENGQTYTSSGLGLRCHMYAANQVAGLPGGMQCYSRTSGHGFTITRSRIWRF